MKFALAILAALAPAFAHADVVAYYTTGQSLYIRFDDASNTAVNLTEGSSLKAGRYVATDAAIDTAGLGSGIFSGRILIGTAGAQSAGDTEVAVVPEFRFNGTVQVVPDTIVVTNLDAKVSEVGGGTEPDDRDLEPVQHVWQLKRSGDGTLRSTNPLYIVTGTAQTIRAGWNCDIASILPPGTVISTETTPVLVTASDDVTITAIGHGEKVAKVQLAIASDAVAGSHWIKTTVTNTNGGGPIAVYGQVVIQAEP